MAAGAFYHDTTLSSRFLCVRQFGHASRLY